MRVLVLGAEGTSANMGVNALGEGCHELIHRAWPGATVDIQAFAPSQLAPLGLGGRAIIRDIFTRNRQLSDFLTDYDAILDVCLGDSFSDIYGVRRLMHILYIQNQVVNSGVPLAFAPQTIGPFKHTALARLAARSLRRASLVMVRDRASARAVGDLGGVVDVIGTDVVFALPASSVERTRDVVLNVSGLLWNTSTHLAASRYQEFVLGVCEGILARGLRLTLVAHVSDNNSTDNDVSAIQAIISINSRIDYIVPENLKEVRDVLGSAKMVVGSRMHACLNSIAMGVPAIPWAYSRKFSPLLSDLGWDVCMDLRTDAGVVSDTLGYVDTMDDSIWAERVDRTLATARTLVGSSVHALQGFFAAAESRCHS